jgi:5-methylcytosine-specific restriction enzyme A
MPQKQPPNPLQKIVRNALRELVQQANHQKLDQPKKLKVKKAKTQTNTSSKQKQNHSRHIPASVRVSVLHRDGYQCVFCGRNSGQIQLEVDHIIPFAQGGSHKLSNLQTLCFDCNRGKGSRRLK